MTPFITAPSFDIADDHMQFEKVPSRSFDGGPTTSREANMYELVDLSSSEIDLVGGAQALKCRRQLVLVCNPEGTSCKWQEATICGPE